MIINTGQRTDIPAFYAKWFINRIRDGYVYVRNPYYPNLVTKFILDPKIVDVIAFCTKNPRPMFSYLDELSRYGQLWYVTITGFEKDIEPNVPSINEVIQDFQYLSKKIGSDSIGWRYTPIIINEKYTIQWHIKTFEYIASHLEGYTSLVVFGFVDLYDKVKKRHPEFKECSSENKIYLAKEFLRIAQMHHFSLRLCSKEKWLSEYGIDVDGCMRIEDYERAIHKHLIIKKKMQARKGYCACYLSNDIGAYNSCPHFCQYCYANSEKQIVLDNYKKHDDNSSFLIGNLKKDDRITEAKQETFIEISLF